MPKKASAYEAQTVFALGEGKNVEVPGVASAKAANALAVKLRSYLPDDAARVISQVVVDPDAVRAAIADDHFAFEDTPSGRVLTCIKTRAWSVAISADGANGRARLRQQRDNSSVDPWPLPSDGTAEPVLEYSASSFDRMADAVTASAETILTQDMITRVRANPRGIWNPPVAVVGRITVAQEDPRTIVHVAEGSTRISAAHNVTATGHGSPIKFATDLPAFIRSERARVVGDLVRTPSSKAAQDAAKLLTVPILIRRPSPHRRG